MSIAVLDWFLLEGGDPHYEIDPDNEDPDDTNPEDEVRLGPDLYEVRMPEFDIFVGPPTECGDWAIEVAVQVRPAIALEVDTVIELLKVPGARLSDRLQIDVYATEDFGSVSTVWLATRLTHEEVESHAIDELLNSLLLEARRLQANLA